MIPSLPSKILVGISLDADECNEFVLWAIKVLARPGDTIIAMHIIEMEDKRKKKATNGKNEAQKSTRKYQNQVRQSKSFVISIMGELVKTCQSVEVNLEARVGLSSSAGKGLIEEAKNIGANYLIIGNNRRNRTNRSDSSSLIRVLCNKISKNLHFSSTRAPKTLSRYCYNHVPEFCSLVLLGRNEVTKQRLHSSSIHNQETDTQSSNKWSEKNSFSDNSFSSEENGLSSNTKCSKPSPKSVLDILEAASESTTEEEVEEEEDSSNSVESFSTTNTSLMVTEYKSKSELKKPMSPFKRISSLLRSPNDRSTMKEYEPFNREKQHPFLKCFSYEEIANATENFHEGNLVGQGGYSEVYKGDLVNGCSIAVKRLTKDNSNVNKEKEFLMELGIIGQVNHTNTAKLVGYCIESGLYLVFEFYPNGTLSSALHGNIGESLDWEIRYRVVLGIARGLHYLHKCCKHRIIHRDIKASNVLLGPDYEPQISDFGLAKWLPSKLTHHAASPIEGTFGYLAPEYFMHGIVDEKTDIFALGILFLEIITGRRPVDPTKEYLLLWARPLMESGKLSELVDPRLEGRYDKAQLYRVVLTASQCVRQSPKWRPSTTEVLQQLTYGQDSEVTRSWRIPKFTSDEMDDYSLIFGYQLPSDLTLDDI